MTGLWAAACVLALAPAGPQAPPTFATGVDNVYVDAFVTRDGQPLAGLTAENFEIHDNGVRQEVRLVSLDAVPVAVLLVFDTSSSVKGEALGHLKAAGHAVLDGLRPGERAALITFNEEVVVQVPPDDDLARVRQALDGLRAHGATALYDAAYVSLALPARDARSVVVLFSDGEDNTSWLGVEALHAVAERSDILLQAVGVNDTIPVARDRASGLPSIPGVRHVPSPRAQQLQTIAESTGGRFWKAEKSERLRETFLRILQELRTRYLLAFQPTGVERAGEHRLEVRLKGAKGQVRSRSRYFAVPSP